MNIEQSVAIMKALADESRLAIVRSLLEKSQYVEEIAKRHALAPSTVSFHLKKLERAGLVSSRKEQYYVVVEVNEPLFNTTLKELVTAFPARNDLQDGRIDEYRRKVLETFFRQGILERLPAQHKKRLIVLEQFALLFEPEQRYSESEVTGLIRPLFNDYCLIRRLLVDEGMICREGSTYWRALQDGGRQIQRAIPEGPESSRRVHDRAEIKRQYKENRPDWGVYQIRNKANGKIYIDSSSNLDGTRRSRMFQLKMGKIVFNPEMQKDLKELGADCFEYSVLDVLPKQQSDTTAEDLLLSLKLHWQEKLQPFGAQGYNNLKKFEREKEQLEQNRNSLLQK